MVLLPYPAVSARNVNRYHNVENPFEYVVRLCVRWPQCLRGNTIMGPIMVVVIMIVVLLVLPFDSSPVMIRVSWYLEPDRVQNTWV